MNILGKHYTVRFTTDLESMGLHREKTQEILVDPALCGEQIISTIFHEQIEAINAALHLELGEGKIRPLEAGLYQALTENGVDLTPLGRELKQIPDS